jgi:hypothetical protein
MVLLVVLLLATMVVAVGPANAGESCHNINAKGEGQASLEPPDAGFDARTVAQIRGGGLLQGTTEAQFFFTSGPPVFTFAGYIEFTTNRGTLTVSFTPGSPGTFDGVTGDFLATGDVTSATGKLSGATGSLTFAGVQDLTDPAGSFTETVTGEICVDLGGNGKR